MSDLYPPFLKWGQYKSKDEKNPDVLNFEALETDTFETEYNICVKALMQSDGEWNEINIPLHSFESKNKKLYTLWHDAVQSNKISAGKKFSIRTWLGISKNKFPIRRFELVT